MWDGPSHEELMSYDEQDRLAEEQEREEEPARASSVADAA